MSEERRQTHPEEPAEGGDEEVDAPGADKPEKDRETGGKSKPEKRSSEHPEEPAEGGEEEVDAPGADKPGGE